MIGPLDIAGSLGVPGQTNHPLVIKASKKVIIACERFGKSCGTQVADVNPNSVQALFELGYNFAILGSDLFVLWKWAEQMGNMMNSMRGSK
jgi:2-dehydro-3-deoxyglucarate aldolase